MKFIADNGFQTPTWLIDTDILRKIEPNGEVTRIVNAQSALISSLLNDGKMTRLIETEALAKNAGRRRTRSARCWASFATACSRRSTAVAR